MILTFQQRDQGEITARRKIPRAQFQRFMERARRGGKIPLLCENDRFPIQGVDVIGMANQDFAIDFLGLRQVIRLDREACDLKREIGIVAMRGEGLHGHVHTPLGLAGGNQHIGMDQGVWRGLGLGFPRRG